MSCVVRFARGKTSTTIRVDVTVIHYRYILEGSTSTHGMARRKGLRAAFLARSAPCGRQLYGSRPNCARVLASPASASCHTRSSGTCGVHSRGRAWEGHARQCRANEIHECGTCGPGARRRGAWSKTKGLVLSRIQPEPRGVLRRLFGEI